ncbi:MAG: hypothetical protein GX329_00735, partial [Tissierellia bacterium]|nr:hypothetical protein [Tissierellia bacterium]
MEAINLNTTENIIDAYGIKPTLYYDVEGVLTKKDGKDIVVDAMVEGRQVSYSLRIKEYIQSQVGDRVEVDKESIVSMRMEEKKTEDQSGIGEDIIEDLELQDPEAKSNIENLVKYQIPVTEENLESFAMSKKYLKEIVHNIDFETCVKLLDMDIDLDGDSLEKVARALQRLNEDDGRIHIRNILGLDRKLTYSEAEVIAKDIYGRIMGRDIYDSIIALHGEGLPVSKENIDRIMEVMDKLHSLKGYEDGMLLDIFREELPISIDSLYRAKHSYGSGSLDENITSPLYERFIVEKEQSI